MTISVIGTVEVVDTHASSGTDGIAELASRLSGGQAQRVALARAVLKRPTG